MATKKAPAGKGAVKAATRPVGRPSKYKPEYVDLAYKFCLLGATDNRLAELFDVNQDTINEWKKVYPEFSESLKAGREIADAEVASSLFHRAKGYSHPDVDIKVIQNQIVETPLIKHYPPDTGAATLWLKNRQGAQWRDKIEVDQKTEVSGTLDVTLSPDEAYLRLIGK